MIQPYQNLYQPPPPPTALPNTSPAYSQFSQQVTVTTLVANHKVDELKEKCRRFGLRVGGTKRDLAARLLQYLQSSILPTPPSPTLSSVSPLPESPSTPSALTSPSSPSKKRCHSNGAEEANAAKKLRQKE